LKPCYVTSDGFKEKIHGKDSQKDKWKDVSVEHKEIFRQLPFESKDPSIVKSGQKGKERDTRPNPSPLKVDKQSAIQHCVTLNLKTYLKVERETVIIDKDSLRCPMSIQASHKKK